MPGQPPQIVGALSPGLRGPTGVHLCEAIEGDQWDLSGLRRYSGMSSEKGLATISR